MPVLGFIGPGTMGMPMAANLVAEGHEVRCYGRSGRSRERAAAAGTTVVASVREACAGADVAVTTLTDGPDVVSVALGRDGIITNLEPGALFVDHSTIGPETARRVHERALAALDAPARGGDGGAIDGTPGFRIELHDGDLAAAGAAARELGLSQPAAALISSQVAALKARGEAHLACELNGRADGEGAT